MFEWTAAPTSEFFNAMNYSNHKLDYFISRSTYKTVIAIPQSKKRYKFVIEILLSVNHQYSSYNHVLVTISRLFINSNYLCLMSMDDDDDDDWCFTATFVHLLG